MKNLTRDFRYVLPLERRPDGSLYQMTPQQQKQAARLVDQNCCNYWKGSCVLLEDIDKVECPQRISYAVCCRWFRNAVLPLAPELEADIFGDQKFKVCERCGARFIPGSNRSKLCPDCSANRRRQKARERMWKTRHKCSHLEP